MSVSLYMTIYAKYVYIYSQYMASMALSLSLSQQCNNILICHNKHVSCMYVKCLISHVYLSCISPVSYVIYV